jgi:CHAD domain-containing protein
VSPYLLPDGLDLDRALAPHLDVRAEPARKAAWTFYDTFDGRLHAAGLILRHGDRRLALLERATGAERASAPAEQAPPKRLLAADLPPALQALLAPEIEVRALTPRARITARSRRLAVLNEDEKTVVRLDEEAPEGLRARLYATAVRGYDEDLARVRQVLDSTLELAETDQPLADEAIVAAGAAPAGVSSKLELQLRAGEPAGAAAEKVLARTREIVGANLPGSLADVDSEFVHDLRVANRRARSLLRQLQAVFPPVPLRDLRDELRWIQQVTGDTRDLDVQLLDFEDYEQREALAPLHGVLERRRARAFAAMKRALTSERMTAVLAAWADLRALPDTPPVEAVAGERIGKVYRRMVKMGGAIDDQSPPEALHDLRKLGKELRYLLEFFGGLFAADTVKPMLRSLRALQDVLGRHQDFEVQADTLRELTQEVAERPGGADALLAMGVLIDGLAREQARARAQFASQFDDFAAKPRRQAVAATFG